MAAFALGDDRAELTGEALLGWFEETATAFRTATASEGQYYSGFEPRGCLRWLKSGCPNARGGAGNGQARKLQAADPERGPWSERGAREVV